MTPGLLTLILLGVPLSPLSDAPPEVVYLSAGAPSPFTGYLFPPERALRMGERIEKCEYERKLEQRLFERALEQRVAAAERAAQIRVDGAEERARIALESAEAAQLAAVREWWDQPGLLIGGGVALGFVAGVGLVAGSVYLTGELAGSWGASR